MPSFIYSLNQVLCSRRCSRVCGYNGFCHCVGSIQAEIIDFNQKYHKWHKNVDTRVGRGSTEGEGGMAVHQRGPDLGWAGLMPW